MNEAQLQPPVSKMDHFQGSPKASIIFVEYGDYECPSCRDAYFQIKQVQKHFGDEMQFVFRNFPLSHSHPHAVAAGLAAEAAGVQGKFWDMHDLLYENQNALEYEDLMDYAELLKLDLKKFAKDIESKALFQRIQSDLKSGEKSGVEGTPSFYINGAKYEGSFRAAELIDTIEEIPRQERQAPAPHETTAP